MWYIYTMEYYSAIKKNEIMPFAATWMDLESVIMSEISQTEKEKYHMITHIWNLKRNSMNELTKQKQTHRLREQINGSRGKVGETGYLGSPGWTSTHCHI